MPCLSLQQCDGMVKNNKQDVMRKNGCSKLGKGVLDDLGSCGATVSIDAHQSEVGGVVMLKWSV